MSSRSERHWWNRFYKEKSWDSINLIDEFESFKPRPKSGIFKCISWLNRSFRVGYDRGFSKAEFNIYQVANFFASSRHILFLFSHLYSMVCSASTDLLLPWHLFWNNEGVLTAITSNKASNGSKSWGKLEQEQMANLRKFFPFTYAEETYDERLLILQKTRYLFPVILCVSRGSPKSIPI